MWKANWIKQIPKNSKISITNFTRKVKQPLNFFLEIYHDSKKVFSILCKNLINFHYQSLDLVILSYKLGVINQLLNYNVINYTDFRVNFAEWVLMSCFTVHSSFQLIVSELPPLFFPLIFLNHLQNILTTTKINGKK